jgi:signal transduction histidine kinase
MIQRLLFLTTHLFIFSLAGNAQNQVAGNYNIRHYNIENGLPSNGIKGLEWDEATGFLWVTTEAGISRFNGVDFKNFSQENTPGMGAERMGFMTRNDKGEIFAFNAAGKVFAIKQNQVVEYLQTAPQKRFSNRFSVLVTDTFISKKLVDASIAAGLPPLSRVVSVSKSQWLVLDVAMNLHSFSQEQGRMQYTPWPEKGISAFFKIGNDYFIANKQQEIRRLNTQTLQSILVKITGLENTTPGNPSNFFLYWNNGMQHPVLFIAEKAWQLSYDDEKMTARLVSDAVPVDAYLRFAQYDAQRKLLFVGTDSKGLVVISQNRVRPIKNKGTGIKERNSYYAQVAVENSHILTNEGHLLGDGGKTNNPLPIKGKFNFRTYTFGDSVLWYTQRPADKEYDCLHRYDTRQRQTTVYDKIRDVQNVAIAPVGNQTIIATANGIGNITADSITYHYRFPAPLPRSDEPFDMQPYQPNSMAFATCNALLQFNLLNNRLDTLFRTRDFCIRSLWQYDDYLFLATYGNGYYLYKNGVAKQMPLDKNKFLLYTHCFQPDEAGFIWISTNRGMFKAKVSDITHSFENNTLPIYYHYFGRNDGMDITEMNGGCSPCALQLRDKTISFPTMDGLLWVNPQTAAPLLPEGNIFVDEIWVNGKKTNHDPQTLEHLPANTKEILLYTGFSAWCGRENIYIEYRLNNEKTWTAANNNLITLNHPSPGSYTLEIRKMNGFNPGNYARKTIRFRIIVPWYKRWWFYLLIGITIFGIIVLALRLRIRQYKIRQQKLEAQVRDKTKVLKQQNEILEKNNTIKTRLISIISHDIVTPLKFLTVAGKNLVDKKQLMSEALQQETINEITNTSQELELLSTNILNWIKYQNENRQLAKETIYLHELVNQVLGVLKSLAKQKKLSLVNKVEKKLILHQYIEPLKILVYNLVTNAIHFSEQGEIVINAVETGNNITISVKDNGVGMTVEQVRNILSEKIIVSSANIDNRRGNGLGYLIIKDLVKMTGATLDIQSKKEVGTEVFIAFSKK